MFSEHFLRRVVEPPMQRGGGILILLSLLIFPANPRAQADVEILDLSVNVETELIVGVPQTLAAHVTASADLGERRAVASAIVTADLVSLDSKGRADALLARLGSVKSDRNGRAVVDFLAPRVVTDRVALRVVSTHGKQERRAVIPVDIKESVVLHLRTDRGVYKPGTDLRWRVTALHGVNSHPMANISIDVGIVGRQRSPIWRGTLKTDAFGMISGSVPIADDAPTGTYWITAEAPDRAAKTSESITVRQVVLPPFMVNVATEPADPRPGQKVKATITASYPHGEPVAGRFRVSASVDGLSLEEKSGKLDRFGRTEIEFTPPIGETGRIWALVHDGAGRSRRADHRFNLPGAGLRMTLVPESPQLAPGKRVVHIVTTDGRGNFVPSDIRLEWTGATKRTKVKSPGVVSVPIEVREGLYQIRLAASATAKDGRVAVEESRVSVARASGTSVSVARSVIAAGEPIAVTGHWPDRQGAVVATLIRNGAPLAASILHFDGPHSEKGRATLKPPVGTFGLATVRLTEFRFDERSGFSEHRTSARVVYLRRRVLDIDIDGVVRHEPGETAKTNLTVRHLGGAPAAGVGIAASVVDERVLALSKPRPDLAEVLADLGGQQDGYRRTDAASRAGLIFAELLKQRSTRADTALVAILASIPPESVGASVSMTEADRVASEARRISEARTAVVDVVYRSVPSLGAQKDGDWVFAESLDHVLGLATWKKKRRYDPWKRPTSWAYARKLHGNFEFDTIAAEVADRRLDELMTVLTKKGRFKRWMKSKRSRPDSIAGVGSLAAYLRVDPWGTAIQLSISDTRVDVRSAGPDLKFGTEDDLQRYVTAGGTGWGSIGSGAYGSIGHGSGRGSLAPRVRIGSASVRGSLEARVRKRFDGTVLWKTGIRTDVNGRVALDIPLADSITGWQLDIEAVGPRGAVGVARGRLETHLARYVDAQPPSGLAVGDVFGVPLVVANHTDKPAKVQLTVKASGAISVEKSSAKDTIPAHATRAVVVQLRALEPGVGLLGVSMTVDGKSVDAFEREVKIEHPGKKIRYSVTDVVDAAKGRTLSFSIDGAADRTARGSLRVFRGTLDRALEGIERLVREPYGCFEQTSSATYPNLLVLSLIKSGTEKAPSGVASRARRFVAKGYQRLISYEVDGGGFSWFGGDPANIVLSAYGLVEFADMAKVYPVDEQMVRRTRKWLLAKQRRDGSWRESENTLGGNSQLATTAYVAWALVESGYRGRAVRRALAYLGKRANQAQKSPYVLALWAAAEATIDKKLGRAGRALAKRLATDVDSKFIEARASDDVLFYASADSAATQATALGAIALHRAGKSAEARAMLRWLKGAGAKEWQSSTQGTVLALRAMTVVGSGSQPEGMIRLVVNGAHVGGFDLSKTTLEAFDISRFLADGKNTVELRNAGSKGLVGVALDAHWRKEGIAGAESAGLVVSRKTSSRKIARGDSAKVRLMIENPGKKAVEMPMLVATIPPGFSAHDIDTAASRRGLARVEHVGNEIRFYFDRFEPGAESILEYSIRADHVVDVLHRPATGYAYYTPEVRGTSKSERLSSH